MARTVAALDFGSDSVRAVQVRLGKTPKIERIGYQPLPRGTIEDGIIKDPETVTAALADLWKREKFSTKQVVFSVANREVVVRQMDLPWVKPAAFRKALPHQVAELLPVPVDKAYLDYHLLAQVDAPADEDETVSTQMARILLVAATSEMIDTFVQVIRDAGLFPVKADLTPFALLRAAQPGDTAPGAADAIVEIGANVTTVVVAQDGQPRFVRILPGYGGTAITRALMKAFDWKTGDAENTKKALGMSTQITGGQAADSIFTAGQPTAPTAAEHPAQAVIDQIASGLVAEIRTSLDYFLRETPDVRAYGRIVLSGGGSLLPGLAARLAWELRLPVEPLTPLLAVRTKAKMPAEIAEQQLSVPVGLALGMSK